MQLSADRSPRPIRHQDSFHWNHEGARFSGHLELTAEQPAPEGKLDNPTPLSSDSPFIEPLSEIYGTNLRPFTAQIMVITEMHLTDRFLRIPAYRLVVLNRLCHEALCSAALVFVNPSDVSVAAANERSRFLFPVNHPPELTICHQLGAIGFAQLFGGAINQSKEKQRAPVLICPFHPEQSLLTPAKLPAKNFSQALLVRRVSDDSLILFDRQSLENRRG